MDDNNTKEMIEKHVERFVDEILTLSKSMSADEFHDMAIRIAANINREYSGERP